MRLPYCLRNSRCLRKNRHPAYHDYENTAKQSIASYIELLRIDESDIYTMELSKSNTFPRLFQLLTEEILYRYWEENINDDKVECNFDDVYYNYDEIEQGDRYWEKAFDQLAMEAYGIPSSEKCHPIYHDIAILQLIGYHSEKFKYTVGIKHLPSTIFTNLLAKYLATKTDKTFLVLRSEALWKETFGEELWNELEKEGRIVTKGHKGMSQKISRRNLKKDNGFDKLVNILKHMPQF